MCGIVGVVRRRARRTPPDPTALAADLVEALAVLDVERRAGRPARQTPRRCVSAVDSALRGAPGVRALLGAPNVSATLDDRLGALWLQLDAIERDARRRCRGGDGAAELETVNVGAGPRPATRSGRCGHDRLRTAAASPHSRAADPTWRSTPTSRCRSRSRRSTGSRCAAATPPGSTCSCASTTSISTPATSRELLERPHRRTRCSRSGSVRVGAELSVVRLQGGGRDR